MNIDNKSKLLVFAFLVLNYSNSLAQEESFPCQDAKPQLKELFSGKTLGSVYIHDCSGPGLHGMSSSYLKAGGTAPEIIYYDDDPADDSKYVAWTCKYSMGNIGDNDPTTAWVEGVKGYGIGEVLIVPCLDLQKPIKIWTGYGKSSGIHSANSRPSVVRLAIIQAETAGATQYGTIYKNLRIVSQKRVELTDVNKYQPLPIPYFKAAKYESESQEWDYNYFLGVEIEEVYKGSKYDDTCISEIVNE